MRRTRAFEEMLRQMALHFGVGDIVKCVFVWLVGPNYYGFMLHMANGEYWYVTNLRKSEFSELTPVGTFELFKFPPPIPAVEEIRPWPRTKFMAEWGPRDINDYIKETGGAQTLFLQDKDRE